MRREKGSCPRLAVPPVVPPLHVIVGSHTLLINGPGLWMPDFSVEPCGLHVAHQFVQLVSRRLSLEVGENRSYVLRRENGRGQHHLHDLVHVSIFAVNRLQTEVLNFPPNSLFQWNEHPRSWICGRISQTANHTAASKSSTSSITIESLGTMFNSTWKTAL